MESDWLKWESIMIAKALHIDVQFSKRVDDATRPYGFVMEFFFRTSLNVDR